MACLPQQCSNSWQCWLPNGCCFHLCFLSCILADISEMLVREICTSLMLMAAACFWDSQEGQVPQCT